MVVRRLTHFLALVVVACGATPATTSTTEPASTTTPTTTQAAVPSTTAVTATPAAYTVDDCDTPPVTFALLCDVYALIAAYHVDAPFEPAALAAGAELGVDSYEPAAPEEGPDSFVCAVPHQAFERICDSVADRLRAGAGDIEEVVEAGVESMIAHSLDPFTYYLPPELTGAFSEDGIITAVGMLLEIVNPAGSHCAVAEGPCELRVVLAVAEGSAYEAGLRPGDVLEGIDGTPTEGLTLVQAASMLDGPEGSEVAVTVARPDGTEEEILVQRRPPVVPTLVAERPADEVGYIRLPDFNPDIPEFLHGALEEWDDADTLVLDLRDNPGGYVDVATLVASEFLPDGLVVRTEAPNEVLEYPVQEGGLATTGPDLIVVVNGGSASAAEILAAVLQERGRATVTGEATFGKDTVQIGFPLVNDGELRVTVARWVTPEGSTVAGEGVVPDVIVEIPPDASPEEVVDLVLG